MHYCTDVTSYQCVQCDKCKSAALVVAAPGEEQRAADEAGGQHQGLSVAGPRARPLDPGPSGHPPAAQPQQQEQTALPRVLAPPRKQTCRLHRVSACLPVCLCGWVAAVSLTHH